MNRKKWRRAYNVINRKRIKRYNAAYYQTNKTAINLQRKIRKSANTVIDLPTTKINKEST